MNIENNYLGFFDKKNYDLNTLAISNKVERAEYIFINRKDYSYLIKDFEVTNKPSYIKYKEELVDSLETSTFISYKYKINGEFDYLNISSLKFNGLSNGYYNFKNKKMLYVLTPALK